MCDEVVPNTRRFPGVESIIWQVIVGFLDVGNLFISPGIGLDPVILHECLELGKLVAIGYRDVVSVKPCLSLSQAPGGVSRF